MKTAANPSLPFRLLAAALLALGLGQAARADILYPGDLDPTFGGDGIVVADFHGRTAVANAVAIRNGVIVAAGYAVDAVRNFALAGFNPDGTLVGNLVTTEFPGGASEANAVAWTADGMVIAAGTVYQNERRFALAKYSFPNWELVPEFGNGGRVITDWNKGGEGNAIAVQDGGRILVAGTEMYTTFTLERNDFALARYHHADGELDTSFDGDGKLSTDFHKWDHAHALAVQRDGRIVAAGSAREGSFDDRFALARYLPGNGALDSSFGGNGKLTTRISDGNAFQQAHAVAIQGDGKIIAAGEVAINNGNGYLYHFALARYLPDGELDPGFGDGGKLVWRPAIAGPYAVAKAVAVQGDGKILVAGWAGGNTHPAYAVLVRLNPDGSLDHQFGSNGVAMLGDGVGNYRWGAMALQPDGRIVLAGTASSGDQRHFLLARYHGRTYTGVEIVLDSVPESPTSDTQPTFEYHMTQPGNRFYCMLAPVGGQGYWRICGNSFTPDSPLDDGDWLFSVRGRDIHGNDTPTVEYRFTVDSTLPDWDVIFGDGFDFH